MNKFSHYTWSVAMDGAGDYSESSVACGYGKTCTINTPARGICPEGWHIPSITEWNTLYSAIGSSPYAMQAEEYWTSPQDDYGFSALPAGIYNGDGFYTVGSTAAYWSATEYTQDGAKYWNLGTGSAGSSDKGKYAGLSVRCVKD